MMDSFEEMMMLRTLALPVYAVVCCKAWRHFRDLVLIDKWRKLKSLFMPVHNQSSMA
jgi:hypothetical protein